MCDFEKPIIYVFQNNVTTKIVLSRNWNEIERAMERSPAFLVYMTSREWIWCGSILKMCGLIGRAPIYLSPLHQPLSAIAYSTDRLFHRWPAEQRGQSRSQADREDIRFAS